MSGPDERAQDPANPEAPTDSARPLGEEELPAASPATDAAAPTARRIEIRLRSNRPLWFRLGSWTFVKDAERTEACYTIDLPAGDAGTYAAELRASDRDSVEGGVAIYELGPIARAWYRILDWSCGAPGACTFEELDELRREAPRLVSERRLYDPCGSLQISELRWDTRDGPDVRYPKDLTLRFSLRTMARVPEAPPGDESCAF